MDDAKITSLLNAAIGLHESFMGYSEKEQAWNAKYIDQLEGRTGIWDYLGRAAVAFEQAWPKYEAEEPDYYESLDSFAGALLEHEPANDAELTMRAHAAIEENIGDMPEALTDTVTITLDRNDAGQVIDGLIARKDLYENTVRHLEGAGEIDEITEVRDHHEAQSIAEHYGRIIETISTQLKKSK